MHLAGIKNLHCNFQVFCKRPPTAGRSSITAGLCGVPSQVQLTCKAAKVFFQYAIFQIAEAFFYEFHPANFLGA